MNYGSRIITFSSEKPKLVTLIMVAATLILAILMVRVKVDTDPENMLSEHETVRIFHHQTKKDFALNDFVVIGVVNEKDPDGVFNPKTLGYVHKLTEFAMTLSDDKFPEKRVVTRDVIAPGTVDAIEQAGLGQVRFEWLMPKPPQTREEALRIRNLAMSNPLLKGTMVSEDGQALAIYLPITAKDFAYQVRKQLMEKIKGFSGDDRFFITGLPVAEDTFGVEMFIQMAISAPLAMLAIFILMLIFFKKIIMIISPMIVAMVTVICTMGLLIGTGNTVHIMSSMIPIFLMPIAVVDSIHILSEFFDTYPSVRDRKKALKQVMGHLFMPMLYTSITSAVGFASLATTPIPPVRVFGLFVAFGIMLAWILTITFIPAYIMLLKEESLAAFGMVKPETQQNHHKSPLTGMLHWLGGITYTQSKLILFLTVTAIGIATWGITKITVNDNPVKWFKKSHEIRVADKVLNDHFGGTYEAYLVLEAEESAFGIDDAKKAVLSELEKSVGADHVVFVQATRQVSKAAGEAGSMVEFLDALSEEFSGQADRSAEADYESWSTALDALDRVKNRKEIFKRPDVLAYVENLQEYLAGVAVVGKSNSVVDVVKKVHQELFEANPRYYRIPDTINGVAQTLISFQNSHKPDDLWHLVTPDYAKANLWVQLKSGDNKDMETIIALVDSYFQDNPPPIPLIHRWAGLTYINVIWQEKMVMGMFSSFMSSFVVVLVLMTILFRSPMWGLLAMVPLTVTIALIYGFIGIIGKDYDMPVAVLSSLTLGLAVDFAIHFLERSRQAYARAGSWRLAAIEMFEEPARAISRNVIVIAVGFTPLLLAPLVPYQTVGAFLAAIMAVSGIATLFILPAMIKHLDRWIFRKKPTAVSQG